MDILLKYIVVFLIGLLATWILVPWVKRIAPYLGMLDEPSPRRIHRTPVPRNGGIAVFAATHLALLFFFLSPWKHVAGSIHLREWVFLFVGSLILLLVGLSDDRFEMRAWFKLLSQLGVALLMFFGGFSFGALLNIQLPWILDLGATLFWFVLLINAFNLIDGMDGACAGLGLIASAGLVGMLVFLHQPSDALVLAALAGACLGFLRYNFNPASVFLGDCGSMFIGFMLAAVSLKANVKQSMLVALLVPLLAVGVPVFDVIMAVWRRMARKTVSILRKDKLACKVFGPDLDHIHHKLMRSGMTQRRAAMSLYGAAIFVCLLAVGATAMNSNRTALLMVGMVVVLHVGVRQLAQIELWTTTQVVLQGVRRPHNVVGVFVACGWDVACLALTTLFVFCVVLPCPVTPVFLATCILIPFATLYFYGVYKVVWSRSRISQILVLALELAAGEVLAFVALLWIANLATLELFGALSLHFVCVAIGIVGGRAALRLVRDLSAWLRCLIGSNYDSTTLLLGAGENAILYLRQTTFEDQQRASRRVVGLIDDNPALHQKVVYGYPVLGTFSQLEEIVDHYEINEIIFTHHYSDEIRAGVFALKEKYELMIREFVFVLRDLDDKGVCKGTVKRHSVYELDCQDCLCNRSNHARTSNDRSKSGCRSVVRKREKQTA